MKLLRHKKLIVSRQAKMGMMIICLGGLAIGIWSVCALSTVSKAPTTDVHSATSVVIETTSLSLEKTVEQEAIQLVSQLENELTEETIDSVKAAIDKISDETVKTSLTQRVAIVEQQLAIKKEAERQVVSHQTNHQQLSPEANQAQEQTQLNSVQTVVSEATTVVHQSIQQSPVIAPQQPVQPTIVVGRDANATQEELQAQLDKGEEEASKKNHYEELKNLGILRPKGNANQNP